jgi:hypothetical protein
MTTISELEKKIERIENDLKDLRARVPDEGVYVLSEWERSEVEKGLAEPYASDAEVATVLAKYGLQNTL